MNQHVWKWGRGTQVKEGTVTGTDADALGNNDGRVLACSRDGRSK
jgi:hypothetical protein